MTGPLADSYFLQRLAHSILLSCYDHNVIEVPFRYHHDKQKQSRIQEQMRIILRAFIENTKIKYNMLINRLRRFRTEHK